MSVDQRRPKGFRRSPVREYRCFFCHAPSDVAEWVEDVCPKCNKKYYPEPPEYEVEAAERIREGR